MAELELTLLDENILDLVASWFDDDKTRIALGDRDWVRQALQLMETQPGTSWGNLTVNNRVVWVAFESGAAVGLIDVEVPTATVRLDSHWSCLQVGAGAGCALD